jgi:hypothetical protein
MMRAWVGLAALLAVAPPQLGRAQSVTNMTAIQGLAPMSALPDTPMGKAALAANLQVTGAIQTGTAHQPLLLPFADQQAQALRDAFITSGDLSQLADGLGTKLAAAYQAKASYSTPKDFTNISPSLANLIAYTVELTQADSQAGKYFFADGTTNGKIPVSAEAAAVFAKIGGSTDVFGKAYGHIAGTKGTDPFGDSRPFQTEPVVTQFTAADYFGKPASNMEYLYGPVQDLRQSPSFPSGHTTHGYTGAVLLAILVPQRYAQQVARGAEYGNDRIVLGAHYAMDVLGGRTLALYDMAHLLANDPHYVGHTEKHATPITDYAHAIQAARAELQASLQSACGANIPACASADTGRFSHADADEAFYDSTQTYGLPVVYPTTAHTVEDVGKVAPEAGYLLAAAFPHLSLAAADQILTRTEGPGGGFLDNGSPFGVYSRLNLYAAAKLASSLTPK